MIVNMIIQVILQLFEKLAIATVFACIANATKIIKEPEGGRQFIEGQSVNQTCIFDVPVYCVWHKNGTHIKIVNRYSYINRKQQGKTEDCSIKINPLSVEDRGWWNCCNMEDSSAIEVVHSNKIWLDVIEMKIDIHPLACSRVNRGSNVTLDCKFNTKVKCSWRKNKIPITIGFKYMDENYQNTQNCSIVLINVGKAQTGEWECQNMVSDTNTKWLSSLPAEITVEDPVIVIHPQSQTFKELPETVFLECTFNMPVNCYWSKGHNDSIANNVRIRYSNSDGIATKDCSITISNFKLTDIGKWQCADKLEETIVSQIATLQLVKQSTNISTSIVPFNCKYSPGDALKFEEIRCSSIKAYPPPNMYWQIDNMMASQELSSIIIHNSIYKNRTSDGFWNSTIAMSMETYGQLKICFNNYSLTCVVVHTGYENEKKTFKVGDINQCDRVSATGRPPNIGEHSTIVNLSYHKNTSDIEIKRDNTCSSCGAWIASTGIFALIIFGLLAAYCYYYLYKKKETKRKTKAEVPLNLIQNSDS